MKNRQISALILSLTLCMLAMAALLLLASQPSRALPPTDRYVAPGGSDASVCTDPEEPCGTVQHAVDVADPGDTIKVAGGSYTGVNSKGGLSQVVYISKTLTLRGGYNSTDFAEPPDPATYPSTLDAEGAGRVIYATGSGVSVTLEGLRLTGGDASGLTPESPGGGFCAEDVYAALVRNSEIVSNTAKYGGGAYYHWSESSQLESSKVYSNTAYAGAGVYFHNPGNPKLTDSDVYSNTSEHNGAGVYLVSGYSDVELVGNSIHHNVATDGGSGGGLYLLNTNDPWLYNNRIYSNTVTSQGGGFYVSGCRNSEVISNTIQDNEGSSNGGGLYVGGCDGCLFEDNTISGNRNTNLTGGGVFLNSPKNLTFRNNQIHDNTAEVNNGGGFFVNSAQGLNLIGNRIYRNHAPSGGGLHFWYPDGVTLVGNKIYGNTANIGGGVHFLGGSDITFVNNVLWANQAAAFGSGLRVENVDGQFLHNTIARSVGTGVAVIQGELTMVNTILVSNTVGIWVNDHCTATLTNTLWGDPAWENETNWELDDSTSTLITGTANYWEDPVFLNPDAGDYHIGPTSGAIDRGADAGVLWDMDDEPRLGVPDLGADEYVIPVYLPLVLRNAP